LQTAIIIAIDGGFIYYSITLTKDQKHWLNVKLM